MSWSGTGLQVNFEGSAVRLTHGGPRMRFSLTVDGKKRSDVFFDAELDTKTLVAGLGPGQHSLTLLRQGEASFGVSSLQALQIEDGQLLPTSVPERRIEIYGDSITCGYGNEGESPECGFSLETENHYLSYGMILARRLGAELSSIAWSGKGVASNYAGEAGPTLVDLADRAIPEDARSLWSYPTSTSPQVVIINLGTNDYSTDQDPPDELFLAEYDRLLQSIRSHHPHALILATVGPLLAGADLAKARKNIAAAIGKRANAGDERIAAFALDVENADPGCDFHPGLMTHQKMAKEIEDQVRARLEW